VKRKNGIRLRKYQLKKGLTYAKALAALKKRATADFRGWSYNKRTGKATAL
jgi:hypothetical protein